MFSGPCRHRHSWTLFDGFFVVWRDFIATDYRWRWVEQEDSEDQQKQQQREIFYLPPGWMDGVERHYYKYCPGDCAAAVLEGETRRTDLVAYCIDRRGSTLTTCGALFS